MTSATRNEISALSLVLSLALPLGATEFVVTNVTDTWLTHRTAENYEGGVAPNPLESTGLTEDIVMTNRVDFVQTLATGNYNPPTSNEIYLGNLLGDEDREFCYNLGYANRTLHLVDTVGWPGLFYSDFNSGNMGLKYEVGDGGHATLPNAGLYSYLRVSVAGKNSRLDINKSQARGLVYLNDQASSSNPGTIALNDPVHGIRGRVEMVAGDLEIAGASYDVPGLVGDPYLHLDATAADSMDKTVDATLGKTFVNRWNDCRGGEGRPYAITNDVELVPFLATDAECGKTVVDFGASLNNISSCGAMYKGVRNVDYRGYQESKLGKLLGEIGYLRLNEKVETIREVFVVLKEVSNHNCFAPFLYNTGDDTQTFPRSCERNNPLWDTKTCLFEDVAPLTGADIRLNGMGVPAPLETSLSGHMNVLSVGLHQNAAAVWIGSNGNLVYKYPDANNGKRYGFGGFALGEMLIYTNALTSAQRREVNAYLKAKWRVEEEALDTDFYAIKPAAGRALTVPSGTVRTRALDVTTDTTVTKRGAGTLEVSLGQTNRFALAVEEGRVRFTTAPTMVSDDPKPAPAPFAWLKAEDASSFTVESTAGEVQSVSAWYHSGNAGTNDEGVLVAARARLKGTTYPTRYADPELGGRYVVDFGPYGTDESSAMEIARYRADNTTWNTGDRRSREGFIVFRSSHKRAEILTSAQQTLFRNEYNNGLLLSGFSRNWYGDYYALDGQPIFALTVIPDNEWHIISYRFAREVPGVGAMCAERCSTPMGGTRFAEAIHYDRELTEREFRDTEAYLIRKYFGKDHPSAVRAKTAMTISKMSFADGATPAVDSDRDMKIDEVAGDVTSFSKTGTGTVAVATLPMSVTTLAAESGRLETRADWLADAALHVDASQEDTIVYRTGQEADKRIDKWLDCRLNGRSARCILSYADGKGDHPTTNALYCAVADASSGLKAGSKYVDFGSSETLAERGGMLWYDASDKQYSPTDVREVHVVFTQMASGNYLPVGGPEYPAADTIVPDGKLSSAFNGNCTRAANAVKKQDGSDWYTANRYTYASGSLSATKFYITSLQFAGNVKANSFALDRKGTCGVGNIRLCEAIVFTGATNTSARCAAIHEYLRKKWKGESAEGMGDPQPVAYESLRAAAGATLAVDSGESALSTKALSGAGTVVAANGLVVDGANPTFEATFTDAATCSKLTVSGALTLPSAGTVVVTSPAGVKLARGFYPILAADSLTVDLAGWTVDAAGAFPHRAYRLVRRGNELGLVVAPAGAAVLVG